MVDITEYQFLKALGINHFPDAMPEWAQKLTLQVCQDYAVKIPAVKWSVKDRKVSSGRAYSEQESRTRAVNYDVSVVAGALMIDTRLVLLHELAHFTNPIGEHHGYNFWNRAFDMYDKYGVSLMYAYNREKTYRAAAEEIGARRIYERYVLKK